MYGDEYYLAHAMALALSAFDEGFSPVGALLVESDTGCILASAKSQRQPGNTKHAEFQILADFQPATGQRLTLYTTLEPCIMCMGLATVARVERVVWLVDDKWAGASKVYDYGNSLYVRNRLPQMERAPYGYMTRQAIDLWITYLENTGESEYIRLMLGHQSTGSNAMIPIYVITNDKHIWLVQGFAYLFNAFWGSDQPVTVVGFNPPPFRMPGNFDFHSLGSVNKPPSEWSNKLIKLLDMVNDTHFILFLEDFWFTDKADVDCVHVLTNWMKDHPDALRMDLWRDRQAKKQAFDLETIHGYQIVETPPHAKYQMSLQANIWNRDLLRQVLKPDENPWQVEIDGSQRLSRRPDLRVLGTRNCPVSYEPVHQKGRFNVNRIPRRHVAYMRQQGWLNGQGEI